ncbi:MAG: hypothetical protein GC200_08540 [Tepidisphaera sp.]|nr:hypothetical protein [Tepidisphaera sp.]
MLRGLAGALLGGLIGAGIWAAIGYYANYEVGLIAVLVGVLAGAGMKIGAGNDTSSSTGGVAVVVAIGAILLGKLGVVHFLVAKHAVVPQVTFEMVKEVMYNDHAHAHLDKGEKLNWPTGKDIDSAESRDDYPPEIVAEVDTEWDSVPAAEHEAKVHTAQAELDRQVASAKWSIEQKAFLHSFGVFDALWAFLAVRAAYGFGSGSRGG